MKIGATEIVGTGDESGRNGGNGAGSTDGGGGGGGGGGVKRRDRAGSSGQYPQTEEKSRGVAEGRDSAAQDTKLNAHTVETGDLARVLRLSKRSSKKGSISKRIAHRNQKKKRKRKKERKKKKKKKKNGKKIQRRTPDETALRGPQKICGGPQNG